ncbi:MAG: hypothetical protein CME01_13435 [Geminicoccus sp.]|nr:hypothetical protein [Geminicoccus sp.]
MHFALTLPVVAIVALFAEASAAGKANGSQRRGGRLNRAPRKLLAMRPKSVNSYRLLAEALIGSEPPGGFAT